MVWKKVFPFKYVYFEYEFVEFQGCNLSNLGRCFEYSKHVFANSHLESCWAFVTSRFMTYRAISSWTIHGKKLTFLWCKKSNQKSGTFQGVFHLTPCMYINSYTRRLHMHHIDRKPHIFNVSNFMSLWEHFNSIFFSSTPEWLYQWIIGHFNLTLMLIHLQILVVEPFEWRVNLPGWQFVNPSKTFRFESHHLPLEWWYWWYMLCQKWILSLRETIQECRVNPKDRQFERTEECLVVTCFLVNTMNH